MIEFYDNFLKNFWNKIDKKNEEECWPWTGCKDSSGYGLIAYNKNGIRTALKAQRVMYQLIYGEIFDNMYICHKCDNRSCCNPSHLFQGTPQDNIDDMISKGRDKKRIKISDKQVEEMRNSYSLGNITQRELANIYNINVSYVSHIIVGVYKKNIGGKITINNYNLSKLNKEDAKNIRNLFSNGMKMRELSKLYNVTFSIISGIINGRYWKDADGPIFNYDKRYNQNIKKLQGDLQ
jgi:hypothetical protein